MELPKLDYFHFYYLASDIGITYLRYLLTLSIHGLNTLQALPV